MNTLFSHFPVSMLIGLMLVGLSGCGARATAIGARAPQDDQAHAVTQPISPLETAPANLETFGALLDRA